MRFFRRPTTMVRPLSNLARFAPVISSMPISLLNEPRRFVAGSRMMRAVNAENKAPSRKVAAGPRAYHGHFDCCLVVAIIADTGFHGWRLATLPPAAAVAALAFHLVARRGGSSAVRACSYKDRQPALCRASAAVTGEARRRWRCRAGDAARIRRPCRAPAAA